MQQQVPEEKAVAIDGKTLRGSYNRDLGTDCKPRTQRAQQQLTAVGIGSGVVLEHRGFSGNKDEAEGAALRTVADQLPPGITVTAERLCARGHRHVLEVKENQPTVYETLSSEYAWSGRAHRTVDCASGGIETRTMRVSGAVDRAVPVPWLDFPGARRAAQVVRDTVYKKTGRPRGDRDRLLDHQPAAGAGHAGTPAGAQPGPLEH